MFAEFTSKSVFVLSSIFQIHRNLQKKSTFSSVLCIKRQNNHKFPERTNLKTSTMSMKNALKCKARAREGTKQFFISLRRVKIEMLEGAVPFYYHDHYKNLPQRDKTTFLFTIFNLLKHFSASVTASVKLRQSFILTWLLSLKTCKTSFLCLSQAKYYSLLPF